MTEDLDVVAIGSAIVDVLAHADDAFVASEGLVKGTMALIDADRAEALYGDMGPAVEVSGGAAANTAAGVASFGARAAFVGKVRDDQLGAVFAHDIRAAGVQYDTPAAVDGPPTARCLIVVTPDAQRTMSTYLGAAVGLRPSDIDVSVVEGAAVTYLEGYMWDPPEAIEALRLAVGVARGAGRKVAFSLSDPFCVDRHRAEFLDLIERDVDVLFANEDEAVSLFEADSLDSALKELSAMCGLVAVTRGAAGSVVVADGQAVAVAAEPASVVDTTGAGDLFAAGFLVGLVRGLDVAECGRLGSLAAAEVISHVGARPMTALSTLL
ncbi:MAG TPA: adenosine kinase [Acidimicrobiales bacterium]|jgi:sugar/nucleoside kinase (ribokinase family)|nr:adenosine kinase [Acidimicrobiales bacterium]